MDVPFLKLLVCYFVLLTSFNVASSVVAVPAYYDHNCTINNNFTPESPYQYNLNTLLMSFYSKTTATDTTAKFYKANFGTPNHTVYGEYMCRGDVPLEVCQDCVQDATSRIASECPNNREAIIWYDQCSVRYSDRYFFSTLHQLPTVSSFSRETRRSGNVEYIELNQTLNNAVVEAETSTKRFAAKEVNWISRGSSLYTLVQCTPDLSPQLCSKCLYGLIKLIPSIDALDSGRILNPSCNLRSEEYRFYYKGNQPSGHDSIPQEFFKHDIQDWLVLAIKSPRLDTSWKVGICITCWKLWDVRNRRIFNGETFLADGIIAHVKSLVVNTQLCFDRLNLLL